MSIWTKDFGIPTVSFYHYFRSWFSIRVVRSLDSRFSTHLARDVWSKTHWDTYTRTRTHVCMSVFESSGHGVRRVTEPPSPPRSLRFRFCRLKSVSGLTKGLHIRRGFTFRTVYLGVTTGYRNKHSGWIQTEALPVGHVPLSLGKPSAKTYTLISATWTWIDVIVNCVNVCVNTLTGVINLLITRLLY